VSRVDRSVLPAPGPVAPLRFPAVHHDQLANGLDVRVIEHRTVPVVCAVLLVRGGAAADPPERPGLAAFAADLLDEGSGGRSALDVAEALARVGADLDVDVGPDAALMTLTTLARHAGPALALLAEMATSPNLADEDIERVRKLRLERLRQLRDHPAAVAERALLRLLYDAHPYGHVSLGSESAVAEATPSEIRAFHRRAYRPDAATVVIAGDLSADALVAAADTAFGRWRAPDSSPPADEAALRPPPAAPACQVAVVPRPGAAQSELRLGQVCASRRTPDYHALVLLNTILGGQFVSRVNMNLRQAKGYTYGARTGFDLRRGRGPFALRTSVHTARTLEAIREARREIEDIRGPRPATAEELALARASVTRGYARGFETAQQVARAAADLALHGLPDSTFEEFAPRVEAVSLDEITRAARTYLDPSRMVTLAVGDLDRIAATLAEAMGAPVILGA
jgi:predicted Zn-dependent peptidase